MQNLSVYQHVYSTFQLIIEFNRAVYIGNPIVCIVLAQVISRPQQATSLHKGAGYQPALSISVVSCALVICLICTPTPSGLRPSGLGLHIKQITRAHDTTITYTTTYCIYNLVWLTFPIKFVVLECKGNTTRMACLSAIYKGNLSNTLFTTTRSLNPTQFHEASQKNFIYYVIYSTYGNP